MYMLYYNTCVFYVHVCVYYVCVKTVCVGDIHILLYLLFVNKLTGDLKKKMFSCSRDRQVITFHNT